MSTLSQQPYLLRAIHEWCVDAGYTPYISLRVDEHAQVPPGYARDGEIVLNVHPDAVQGLELGDDWLSFSARFGGVARRVEAPIVNVLAIFARETGEGMSFAPMMGSDASVDASVDAEPPEAEAVTPDAPAHDAAAPSPTRKAKGKPALRIVK